MPVTTATTATNAQPAPKPADTDAPAKAVVSSDFETFLKMLTVQMENQDPLNPVDSADYAVQLATFSGVEQQVLTNDLLKSLTASMGQGQLSDLSHWIGKEVPAAVTAPFNGAPLTLDYKPRPAALSNELIVRSEAGAEVHRMSLPNTAGPIEWDGRDASGTRLPAGNYSFAVAASDNDGPIAEDPVPVYLRVTEVRRTSTGSELLLDGGARIDAGEIKAIRAAPGA